MKNIILFITIFLLYTVSFTQSIISEAEKQKLVTGLENGDYSVLDPYLSREKLYPMVKVRNGFTIDSYGTLEHGINDSYAVTNYLQFTNINDPIVYTNQYGIPFIESQKLSVSINILTNLRKSKCTGFEDNINAIISSQTIEEINKIDYDFGDSSYLIYSIVTVPNILKKYLLKVYPNQEFEHVLGIIIDSPTINSSFHSYILNKISPLSLENKKIELLNYLIYKMFESFDKSNEIRPTPSMYAESCFLIQD